MQKNHKSQSFCTEISNIRIINTIYTNTAVAPCQVYPPDKARPQRTGPMSLGLLATEREVLMRYFA